MEGHQPLVVGHRAVRPKDGADRLVALEALDGLPNRAHGHLRGQAELPPEVVVASLVDAGLGEHAHLEARVSGVGGGAIEGAHRGSQLRALLRGREQAQLQGQSHIRSIRINRILNNHERRRHSSPPLKLGVSVSFI